MTTFAALLGAFSSPIDTLEGFDRDRAIAAGINPRRVKDWEGVYEVYFGATRYTAQQRAALHEARDGRLSLDQLVLIEDLIRHVDNPSETWRLRRELLGVRGRYDTLKRKAADIVPAKEKKAPKEGVRTTRSVKGLRSLTMTAKERDVADIEFAISQNLDAARPEAVQKLENLMALLRGPEAAATGPNSASATSAANPSGTSPSGTSPDGANTDGANHGASSDARSNGVSAGVPHAVPRPMVIIGLDQHIQVLEGGGDDLLFRLTDGTTMTGAEYLTMVHAKTLEVAAFHPQYGAVNTYRAERFANSKQRDLAKLTTPMCPVPGCKVPSDLCQIHHIEAWKNGGQTNVDNLVPLCRHHNRTNDDDHCSSRPPDHDPPRGSTEHDSPLGSTQTVQKLKRNRSQNRKNKRRGRGTHGRIGYFEGRKTWFSPAGFPATNEGNESGAMNILFGDP